MIIYIYTYINACVRVYTLVFNRLYSLLLTNLYIFVSVGLLISMAEMKLKHKKGRKILRRKNALVRLNKNNK